jgi:PAS domain S-box-containing protein
MSFAGSFISRRSIRQLISLLLLGVAIPVMLAVLALGVQDFREAEDRTRDSASELARLATLKHEDMITQARQLLETVPRTPGFDRLSRKELRAYFRHILATHPQYAYLDLVGPDGRVKVSPFQDEPGEVTVEDRPYFQEALRTGSFIVGPTVIARIIGEPVLPFALSLPGVGGPGRDVLLMGLKLLEYESFFSSLALPGLGHVALFGRQGSLLLSQPAQAFPAPGNRTPAERWLPSALPRDTSGVFEASDVSGQPMIYAYRMFALDRDSGQGLGVLAGIPAPDAVQEIAAHFGWVFLVLALVAGAATAIGGPVSARIVTAGLTALEQGAARMSRTRDLAPLPEVSGCREVRALGRAFNDMARSIREHEEAREQAGRELRESEERTRGLFESSPVGLFRSTPEGRLLEANPALAAMFDYDSPGHMIAEAGDLARSMYLVPEDRPPIVEIALSAKGWACVRTRFRRRSGSAMEAELTLRLARDARGTPLYLEGAFEDVTEFTRMSRNLFAASQQMETIFSTTHVCIACLDRDFTFTRVNRAYAESGGYPEDFFPGRNHFDLYPGEGVRDIFRQVLETGEPHTALATRVEFSNQPERGPTYWDWTLNPVQDHEGRVEGLLLTLMDVTEAARSRMALRARKEELEAEVQATIEELQEANLRLLQEIEGRKGVEAALARQLALLQVLLDTIPLPVFLKDADRRYMVANTSLERFLGRPREHLDGLTASDIYGPDLALEHGLKDDEILAHPGLQVYESRLPNHSGEMRDVLIHKAAHQDSWGAIHGLVGVIVDITDRKRREDLLRKANLRKGKMAFKLAGMVRALREARRRADEASQAKSDFLARMSHEIRTPLNAILGMTEIVLDTALDRDQRECLEAVHHSGGHLLHLINDILDLSKIEARMFELSDQDFDPARAVHAALAIVRPLALEKGLALETELPPGLPPLVRGDESRFRQVLINLAGNAVKFTAAGRVTVRLRQLAPAPDPAPNPSPGQPRLCGLEIRVEDTGRGIPPEMLERIFTPFEQVREPDGATARGTGLGLSICRQFLERMGGGIRAESTPGRGSTFIATLLLALPEPQAPDRQDPTPGMDSGDLPDDALRTRLLTVLLAEDNPLNVKVATRFLARMGHSTLPAENGREALELLARVQVDLVLMDLEMPDLDGFAATVRIRAGEAGPKAAATPILAMTAHALAGHRERCLAAGMDGFLTKPVSFQALAQAIAQLFRSPALRAEPGGPDPAGRTASPEAAPPAGPEPAPGPAVLDRDAALEALDGDEALYADISDIFLDEYGRDPAFLARAAGGADLAAITLLAHSLKSASGSLGAWACRDAAAALEQAGHARDRQGITERLPALEQELARLIAALRARSA